ncbi:histidine kinase dimerization/phospho-acceptor domain-containing protein [Nocardioides dongkuii]|uniref:histidine kinase dimerization/phospho-acceptor domain-containing protein n=1 Tax=Nocardioides dongkuii TaxID=2760089 RepID=UPI00187891A9|nr:histidine kinase dimerization/phospho-acceptor domain-containing protein [Nocardioides dongkuii]
MRERLVGCFVVLALLLLVFFGAVRGYTLGNELRELESARVHERAATLAAVVEARAAAGEKLGPRFLDGLVRSDELLVLDTRGATEIEARGQEYDDADGLILATSDSDEGELTVAVGDHRVSDLIIGDPWALAVLVVFSLLGAAVAGLLVARALGAPFRRLADAAGALGRGRFDLDLPTTRIPEAQAIARSLSTSANQLRDRLRRDQDFAAHTSHSLRSPMTGLRLEVEELTLRDDLPDDVHETLVRTLAGIQHVDRVAGELVDLQRGSLVESAQVPLGDLATQVAQRWADRLALDDRELTAAVEGELDQCYTPGPVEHLLDLVLVQVLTVSRGGVRLVLDGATGGHLRISITTERSSVGEEDPFDAARAVCEALGGRWTGTEPMDGLTIFLPRR